MRVAVQYKDGKTEDIKKVSMITKGKSDYFIRLKDDTEKFIDANELEFIVILEEERWKF